MLTNKVNCARWHGTSLAYLSFPNISCMGEEKNVERSASSHHPFASWHHHVKAFFKITFSSPPSSFRTKAVRLINVEQGLGACFDYGGEQEESVKCPLSTLFSCFFLFLLPFPPSTHARDSRRLFIDAAKAFLQCQPTWFRMVVPLLIAHAYRKENELLRRRSEVDKRETADNSNYVEFAWIFITNSCVPLTEVINFVVSGERKGREAWSKRENERELAVWVIENRLPLLLSYEYQVAGRRWIINANTYFGSAINDPTPPHVER